jgi:hypothetical protein
MIIPSKILNNICKVVDSCFDADYIYFSIKGGKIVIYANDKTGGVFYEAVDDGSLGVKSFGISFKDSSTFFKKVPGDLKITVDKNLAKISSTGVKATFPIAVGHEFHRFLPVTVTDNVEGVVKAYRSIITDLKGSNNKYGGVLHCNKGFLCDFRSYVLKVNVVDFCFDDDVVVQPAFAGVVKAFSDEIIEYGTTSKTVFVRLSNDVVIFSAFLADNYPKNFEGYLKLDELVNPLEVDKADFKQAVETVASAVSSEHYIRFEYSHRVDEEFRWNVYIKDIKGISASSTISTTLGVEDFDEGYEFCVEKNNLLRCLASYGDKVYLYLFDNFVVLSDFDKMDLTYLNKVRV